jgi:hypothetical protein
MAGDDTRVLSFSPAGLPPQTLTSELGWRQDSELTQFRRENQHIRGQESDFGHHLSQKTLSRDIHNIVVRYNRTSATTRKHTCASLNSFQES